MPVPAQRDPEQARSAITSWLSRWRPGATDIDVSAFQGPGATGFSNETLIFDASWTEDGERHDEGLVIRVKPTGFRVFLEADFESQWRVMSALAEHTDIPIPPMLAFESDPSVLGAPFILMGKVRGAAPADNPPYTTEGWLFDGTPEQQRRLCEGGLDTMARVHLVDWRGLDLGFLDKTSRGPIGLTQQLDYYREYLAWASAGRPQPIAEAALVWLEANRPPELAEGVEDIRLSWGDARIGNMLWDDFTCSAVLDWEMVTLGHPAADVAWWLFLERHHSEGMSVAPLPGFPTRGESIARYEAASGIPVAHLVDYYEVLAGYRFAVIMMRLAQMLEEYGLVPAGTDMETNNIPTQLLAKMLGLPAPGPPFESQLGATHPDDGTRDASGGVA